MNLEDCILTIDGVFNKTFSEYVIKYIDKLESLKKLKQLEVGSSTKPQLDLTIRNVKGYHMLTNSYWNERQTDVIYGRIIKDSIKTLFMNYKVKFPGINPLIDIDQIDLLKYNVGGHYKIHCDMGHNVNRSISVIINLNDDYEGGELMFYSGPTNDHVVKKISLKKGSMVFFPSNFLFPHRINPITRGTRYSIVAWMV